MRNCLCSGTKPWDREKQTICWNQQPRIQKGDWEGGACVDESQGRMVMQKAKRSFNEGQKVSEGAKREWWVWQHGGQRRETLMKAVSMESGGWNLFEQVDEKMGDDWRSDHRQCFEGGLQRRGEEKQESNQNDFLFCFLKQKTLEQVSFLIVVIQEKITWMMQENHDFKILTGLPW